MGVEILHADGWTDGHDEAKSRFSQLCEKRLKMKHFLNILKFLMMTFSKKAETCRTMPFYNVSQIQLSLLNYALLKNGAKSFPLRTRMLEFLRTLSWQESEALASDMGFPRQWLRKLRAHSLIPEVPQKRVFNTAQSLKNEINQTSEVDKVNLQEWSPSVGPFLQSSTVIAFDSFVYHLQSVIVTELTNRPIA